LIFVTLTRAAASLAAQF